MQCHLIMIGCIAELAKARAGVSERSPIDNHEEEVGDDHVAVEEVGDDHVAVEEVGDDHVAVEEVGDDHVAEVGDEEAELEVDAEENPPGEAAEVAVEEEAEVEVEEEEEEARPIQVLQEAAANQQTRDPVMFLVRSC